MSNMKKLFKRLFKEEITESKRLYNIANTVNMEQRVKNIVEIEFKNMILKAEKAALLGEKNISYDLNISEQDKPFINLIIHSFIEKLENEGFTYSRRVINQQRQFNIYFTKPTKKYKDRE